MKYRGMSIPETMVTIVSRSVPSNALALVMIYLSS